MKRALVICFNDLKIDTRVRRQIGFLKPNYSVTVCCYDANPDTGIDIFLIKKTELTFLRKAVMSFFLLLRIHHIAYRLMYGYEKYIPELRERNFDLIVANDIETLPFAFKIATKAKVFFDAHEYAPRQFEDRLYWRLFFQHFITHLCRKFIPQVSGMSTINKGIADEYEKNFSITPIIITNASEYINNTPVLRNEYPIRLVHHGIFTLSRSPALMIDLMKLLDNRFSLDLIYLVSHGASKSTKEYYEKFKIEAEATGKIRVLPALKSHEIISFVHAHYDMGLILVPPVNFNYQNGLPNKLFDCIQARLGMAVGPLREIARITRENDIGVVSEGYTAQSMADALRPLTLERVNDFKKNSHVAAAKLNASYNKTLFLEAIDQIS